MKIELDSAPIDVTMNNMTQTIIPSAPEIDPADELEAAAVSATGALILAAKAKRLEELAHGQLRRDVPRCYDDNIETWRP